MSDDTKALAVTPMTLLQSAKDSGATIEQMAQLMELQFKWEENEARKAYNEAISAFKSEGVKIDKNRHVRFQTTKGMTSYKHATLDNLVGQVTPIMSKYGLSHTWSVKQDNAGIEVICKIAHVKGHSETVSMKAEADDSGGKNKIQQIGSTVTYLQRYTLLAALGLATTEDDDGKGSEPKKEPTITEEQAANIKCLIDEVKADMGQFCTYMKVETISDIPAKQYNNAIKALEAKRRA